MIDTSVLNGVEKKMTHKITGVKVDKPKVKLVKF